MNNEPSIYIDIVSEPIRSIVLKKNGPDWFTLWVWKIDPTKPNCWREGDSYCFNSEIVQEIDISRQELLDKLGVK